MKNNKSSIPLDGLNGLKQNFSSDALSGFLVFLLAMPLSLGIAKASDFPAIFGLVTAIIGGIVVSFFSGSLLTIKGPAAGLIVIAAGGVEAFGGGEMGWRLTLGTIVVAGIIQIIFGQLKLGKLADFFPGAAIHGMLAAIGVIIMSKQIHVLLGIDPKLLKGKEPLELIGMIPESIMHENAHVTEIGIACLAIMVLFGVVKNKYIKRIPAPLVVLAVAIPLGLALHIKTEGGVSNFALVKIGNIVDAFGGSLLQADFSGLKNNTGIFIEYVILFALIGSIESLLTAKAIDHLDPYKRKSDFNKDLTAVGIGNTIAGLLGGLPMISEVARSSANVGNGAKTRWANFFHGLFLLLSVLFAVPLIELIPNAALAAMLIYVGFRLAHPKEFAHMWHIGKQQFVVFVATVVITLATDLLLGVGSGILLETIFCLYNGASVKNLFKSNITVDDSHEACTVKVNGELLFSNIISFKKKLNETMPSNKKLVIDVSSAPIVDHTAIMTMNSIIDHFKENDVQAEVVGFENHVQLSKAPTSTRILKKNNLN